MLAISALAALLALNGLFAVRWLRVASPRAMQLWALVVLVLWLALLIVGVLSFRSEAIGAIYAGALVFVAYQAARYVKAKL
jgi:hypothetical protein